MDRDRPGVQGSRGNLFAEASLPEQPGAAIGHRRFFESGAGAIHRAAGDAGLDQPQLGPGGTRYIRGAAGFFSDPRITRDVLPGLCNGISADQRGNRNPAESPVRCDRGRDERAGRRWRAAESFLRGVRGASGRSAERRNCAQRIECRRHRIDGLASRAACAGLYRSRLLRGASCCADSCPGAGTGIERSPPTDIFHACDGAASHQPGWKERLGGAAWRSSFAFPCDGGG